MDEQDKTALNDNYSFEKMTCNPARQFADQAVTRTVVGLVDRGVSHYHVARSLFDMALSISAKCDVKDWWYLLEYFCNTADIHHENLKSVILDDSE